MIAEQKLKMELKLKTAMKRNIMKRRVMSMKDLTLIKGLNGRVNSSTERLSSNESKYGASTNSKVTKKSKLTKQRTSFNVSKTPTFSL